MKGAIDDEGKEINPIMFPRLHIKNTEKGGPKAPPRNKMALYDKLTIPSQTSHSASGSLSFFPLPLRNYSSRPSSSRHVSSSDSIQFGTSGAPTFLTEKIHDYHYGVFNLTYLFQPDDFFHCENSLKIFDGEDALEARDSSQGRNSFYNVSLNNNDEGKLKSQKSFRKRVNINDSIELKSNQFGKNQIEEHTEVSQICQKPMKFRNLEEMKIGHTFFKEEVRNMSGNSSKTLQGSNCQTHEDNATLGDKINLNDGCSRKCFQGKRDMHKIADTYRHCDIPNKPISDSTLGTPDDVIKVIGVKKFWKARSTIINQRRLFLVQVFELHRLIQVQRLIARSPHQFPEDNLFLLTRPSLEVSTLKKLPPETTAEQTSSIAKLNSTFMKPDTEHAENDALGKIPILSDNNISRNPIIQLPNYGHHSGNQWLVPIMSPSEGLVYKPFTGPCPPNAGFTAPVHGACGPMSLKLGNDNNASDEAHAVPASHQGIGFLSGTHLPQLFPPCDMMPIMHPSISPSAVDQQMNPFANTMLYQSSCNMPNQMSQMASNLKHVSHYESSKDLQLQINTACNPSKRMNEEACCLIPLASSSVDKNSQVVGHEPRTRVIKAKPYNPQSASESAARIFRSIQEERKHL